MLDHRFIWLSLAVAVFGNIFYIKDTLSGNTKPNRVTFLLWGLAPLISYFAQKNGDVGSEILYTLVIAIIPLVIFAASFVNKNAYWQITKFDVMCGAVSVFALFSLFIIDDPSATLGLSILADFFAALPTLVKSYHHPESETALAYSSEVVSSVIVLLTITQYTFINSSFAGYIFVMNLLFSVLLLKPKLFHRRITDS